MGSGPETGHRSLIFYWSDCPQHLDVSLVRFGITADEKGAL